MIIYFSATGNCKYVAEQIAEAIGDQACSIERFKRKIKLSENEIFGIVTPTYAGEVPIIVRKYLEKLTLTGNSDPYVFVLATYGTTPGAAGADAAHLLKKRGISVCAKFSIKMPDTWTPIFDLSNTEKVNAQNSEVEKELKQVIQRIEDREQGNFMKLSVPYPVRYISDLGYQMMRKTKHFRVEDSCIGCGVCEKKCPAKAIKIQARKPVWVRKRCVMCLRCLHSCPKFAIHYGKNTKKHGQYRNPNVTV